jgi:hypothetical protein
MLGALRQWRASHLARSLGEEATRYVVLDRNHPGGRSVLAGPFATREEAEAEASLWSGSTDPCVAVEGSEQEA